MNQHETRGSATNGVYRCEYTECPEAAESMAAGGFWCNRHSYAVNRGMERWVARQNKSAK